MTGIVLEEQCLVVQTFVPAPNEDVVGAVEAIAEDLGFCVI